MSTRGFVGFVADGKEKIAYCHYDAYPDGLGLDVLNWLIGAAADMERLQLAASALRVVTAEDIPTAEDVEQLRPWTNLHVGEKSTESWYCLLRETQGAPGQMLRAGVIEDASNFPADSLFAEWGYVVDVDAGTFEAYEGFQEKSHEKGRFANRELRDTGYHPVALVASWPLKELPTEAEFLATLYPEGNE
jgi:hypothetical protein